MEFATATASGVVSKIGEYVAESTINQGRYLCCFTSIVKELEDEEAQLTLAKDGMNRKVERAKYNTQIIYKEVEKWQSDADNILEEVEGLRKEIDEKKSCVSGWLPNWCCRYWLGRKAAKKTSNMLKLRRENKFDSVGYCAPLPDDSEFLPRKNFELFQSSKSAFEQIIEALKNDKISLVGLYGMGGSGKTTLAEAVGQKVKEVKMFDKVIMVVISQSPNVMDIQEHLAKSLHLTLDEKTEEDRAKRLRLRFIGTDTGTDKKQETQKNILVILDDVWESFDLEAKLGIRLEGDHKGCKVLLTTRLQQVCIDMDCQQIIQLNILEEKEGLALLKRHAGIHDEYSELNDVAVDVAKECGGLPLALVAIGRALKKKRIHEWKDMSQKLKRSKLEDTSDGKVAGEKGIYAILKVSYDNLNGEKIKSCFLLCSLFPEDHHIDLEELLRYAKGLSWYDAYSIEEARNDLFTLLNRLKDSGLLIDSGANFMKMHDMVRDVAISITSEGGNVFMRRVGMEHTHRLKDKGLEIYTAISLIDNKIEGERMRRVGMEHAHLLLAGGIFFSDLKVSDECFGKMEALKVLSLRDADLSLKSLQFLVNLKTLELIDCNLRDISYFKKLNTLEILFLRGHSFELLYGSFNELPREIGEIHGLRLLNADGYGIRSNVLNKCSELEELHIGIIFGEVEEKSAEGNNARIFEVISQPSLKALYLNIDAMCLPKDLRFPELQRYVICVNNSYYEKSYHRALKISRIEATSLISFEALYKTLEYLCLEKVTGCRNILPSVDQGGLTELKEVQISGCDMLQEVFQLEGLCHTGEQVLLRMLTKLKLESLLQLRHIWKGPTHHVKLQSLAYLCVDSCEMLEYVFPISIAQDLVGLEKLIITNAPQLKQVFYVDDAREENIVELNEKYVVLPKIRELRLESLKSLTNFLPKDYYLAWPMLEELYIINCSSLIMSFNSEVKMQDLKEKLQVLEIGDCHNQLCDELTLSCLTHGFINLEALNINNCGVKAVFQLEGFLNTIDGERKESSVLSLKKLRLESLTELEDLAKGPKHILSLQSLTNLIVNNCPKLRHVFSPTLVRNLQLLEKLQFKKCEEMEHIIVEDNEEDHPQPLIFPNLRCISVEGCGKLKYLLPINVTQHLRQLEFISVERCHQLEKLFGHKDGVDVMNDKEIILPQLKQLTLNELPSFTNFCPMAYPFILKSNDLSMRGCHDQMCVEHHYDIGGPVIVIYGLQQELRSLEEAQGLCKGPTKILSPQNLSALRIMQCQRLKHIFTSNLARDLLQLKVIFICGCKELEQIIVEDDDEDHIQTPFFPNLSSIEVRRCNKLKHLFPITIAAGLQKLESIYVQGCDQLQNVFGHQNGADDKNVKEIMLPRLKKLHICDCEELEQIIVEDDEEYHIQTPFFPNLSEIRVSRCNKLKHLFLVTIAAGLQQLESICVQGCDQLQNVFGHKNEADDMNVKEIVLPQLKKLSFIALPNLTNFGPLGFRFTMQLKRLNMEGCNDQMWKTYFGDWEDISVDSFKVTWASYEQEHVSVDFQLENGGCGYEITSGVKESDLGCVGDRIGLSLCRGLTLTLTLQNLVQLSIDECHKMIYIFSSNLARNLLQLEWLTISKCEELEQIIFEEDYEDDHIQTPSFPNLFSIAISGCNKLKHVFPINMLRGGLQQLKCMDVRECDKLEEVFVGGDRDGDDIIDDKEVVLYSQLELLTLVKLQRLTNFCSTGYHCIFLDLSLLEVKECGKMATRFSRDEKGSVHAEGKPPNEGGNHDDEPTVDIVYNRYVEEATLPPYVEENEEQGMAQQKES